MFSCVILSIGWVFLCDWQMSDHWHCICTGWTQPLIALSPCHDSRGGGRGGSWHHISAALAVSAWTLPYGKGRHGQACTLKYPVTMGREEWEREWKSAPSVLPITPTAWWTSWESILLPLLLGSSHVFKVEVIPFILKLMFTSFKKELLKRSSRAQCRIQIRFPLN